MIRTAQLSDSVRKASRRELARPRNRASADLSVRRLHLTPIGELALMNNQTISGHF